MIMVTIETYATSSERRVASPHPKSPNGHEYALNCIMASRGTTEIGTLNIRYLNSSHCKIYWRQNGKNCRKLLCTYGKRNYINDSEVENIDVWSNAHMRVRQYDKAYQYVPRYPYQ